MEGDIYEILDSYKQAIDVILGRLDEAAQKNAMLEEKVNKLESILFDEILEPARLSLEEDDRNRRFGEFSDKYGERLGAYDQIIGAAEGNPDFSLARQAFDNYEELPEPKPEQDIYIDELVETVEGQISNIKESLGLPPETEVEVKQDENGDTTIKADGETIVDESIENVEEKIEDKPTEETQGEFDFTEEEEETDPEELKKFEEELAKQL